MKKGEGGKIINSKGDEIKMTKRKAQMDAAKKNNQTPLKNKQETEFSAEYTHGEDTAKGKNRNSAKGMKGRS